MILLQLHGGNPFFWGWFDFFHAWLSRKGSKKPPGTSWGSWPKRRKWPTEIRWEASRLLAVQSWREKQPKRCTQFFFVQANPCNITSNICIQLPCGVIQQTMVISDKLYIPMVWPGISQTSIGEKHPKSLMIKKSQLGCRNSPWSKIFSWMRNPNKEQNLWWSKSKTRVVFNVLKKKMIPRPNFDLLYLLHQNLGFCKKSHLVKRYRV